MSNKEIVSNALARMPDDVSLQELIREIEFVTGVLEGLESYEKEGSLSTEEVRANLSSWIKAATK